MNTALRFRLKQTIGAPQWETLRSGEPHWISSAVRCPAFDIANALFRPRTAQHNSLAVSQQ
jgi:hypothetical protein